MWHRQSRNPTYSAANGQKWSLVDYLPGSATTGPHSESAERASSVKAAQHDRLSGSLPGPSATPASTQAVPAPRKRPKLQAPLSHPQLALLVPCPGAYRRCQSVSLVHDWPARRARTAAAPVCLWLLHKYRCAHWPAREQRLRSRREFQPHLDAVPGQPLPHPV